MATLNDALDKFIKAYEEFVHPDDFRLYTKAEAIDAALISIANTTSFFEIEERLTEIYLEHDHRWQRIFDRSKCPPLLTPSEINAITDYMDIAVHNTYLRLKLN